MRQRTSNIIKSTGKFAAVWSPYLDQETSMSGRSRTFTQGLQRFLRDLAGAAEVRSKYLNSKLMAWVAYRGPRQKGYLCSLTALKDHSPAMFTPKENKGSRSTTPNKKKKGVWIVRSGSGVRIACGFLGVDPDLEFWLAAISSNTLESLYGSLKGTI